MSANHYASAEAREAYVDAEIESAGLVGVRAATARAAALSVGDFLDDDDFELCVELCIRAAEESVDFEDLEDEAADCGREDR
jgi:hypothetical protein